MDKLRERLGKRQKEIEASQGWFESWFNKTPWMTTLVSTLMGPLLILLLIIMIGPCILTRALVISSTLWTAVREPPKAQDSGLLSQTMRR